MKWPGLAGQRHQAVIWASDFLTVDNLTGCLHVLFFLHVATRRVVLGSVTPHPTAAWMAQVARNVTAACDGPLLGARYLLHDRDAKYTAAFDSIIASAGVQVRQLPSRTSDPFIFLHERQVRRVLTEYLDYYHAERAHLGLDGQPIEPKHCASPVPGAPVIRRPRLGGLLNYYHGAAA